MSLGTVDTWVAISKLDNLSGCTYKKSGEVKENFSCDNCQFSNIKTTCVSKLLTILINTEFEQNMKNRVR